MRPKFINQKLFQSVTHGNTNTNSKKELQIFPGPNTVRLESIGRNQQSTTSLKRSVDVKKLNPYAAKFSAILMRPIKSPKRMKKLFTSKRRSNRSSVSKPDSNAELNMRGDPSVERLPDLVLSKTVKNANHGRANKIKSQTYKKETNLRKIYQL